MQSLKYMSAELTKTRDGCTLLIMADHEAFRMLNGALCTAVRDCQEHGGTSLVEARRIGTTCTCAMCSSELA